MPNDVQPFLDLLEPIAADVVAPAAARIDATGEYPRAALHALGEAGVLGLSSAQDVGGLGLGQRAAALVIERLGRECASTAMVVAMHYAAAAVIEAHGPRAVRHAIAAGRHVSTLAFSEAGARSPFWAPLSTAAPVAGNGHVKLDAKKSWITSAGEADSYVWSSKPLRLRAPAPSGWCRRRPADCASSLRSADWACAATPPARSRLRAYWLKRPPCWAPMAKVST